jgi:hypothetical protein
MLTHPRKQWHPWQVRHSGKWPTEAALPLITTNGRSRHRPANVDNRVLILGERHLDLVLREYLTHYNRHRPHQSRRQRPPDIETQPVRHVADLRHVRRKPVVVGVINEYRHAA